MQTPENVSRNIRRQLLREMKAGIFAHCSRLPRETELAENLGISRTQLRDVLSDLEREGFITRRHGVGTVINRHVLAVKNRMDIETEFMDIIRQSGYEPGVAYVRLMEEPATPRVARRLGIPEGTAVVRVCRLCTADGRPAIYCEDVIEKRFVKGSYTVKDLEPPIFNFLNRFCHMNAYMDLTELHAVVADGAAAQALELPSGTPVLNMEEVDFDIDGNRIFYSSQYFADDLFQQTVLRKKL